MNGHFQRQHIHVLIVGAGLTGLILAQALRNFTESENAATSPVHITFEIFERDPHAFFRGGGWSLTIHWALTDLSSILPRDIMSKFEQCLVNREAAEKGVPGNFQYLNLLTGKPVEAWPIPPGAASRVAREKLLALLMTDLDIQASLRLTLYQGSEVNIDKKQWSKHVVEVEWPNGSSVTAKFADGTQARGNLLVGCDGSRSAIRRHLCPTSWRNNRLPVRLIGLRVEYPVEKVAKCLAMDPHFFQGGDPQTNVYFWFSFIHMPRAIDEETLATCQMMVSWPYRDGSEMPNSNEAKRELIRKMAHRWAEPFRELVHGIPETTELREILLEDWPPVEGCWDNHNGRVTLVGDAAHCMTMFRGEAANHGVIDVSRLVKAILPLQTAGQQGPVNLAEAVKAYEVEMIARTHPAALKSRQACIDANNFASVNKNSPLIAKRSMKE